MNRKELGIFFALVVIVLIGVVAYGGSSGSLNSNTRAAAFVPDEQVAEDFYVGQTETCNLWHCEVNQNNGIAVCKCEQ
ncbi:hypothetical protein KO465_03820 [Candidatus Micrarchaeota archaeon]|nr:hypothetical protein [Candidatus Micrarchaeota archaeon]